MTTRRDFLQASAGSLLAAKLPAPAAPAVISPTSNPPAFVDLLRGPDAVTVRTSAGEQLLRRQSGQWIGEGVTVSLVQVPGALRLMLSAPAIGVSRVGLRWNASLPLNQLLLGDAWERGYGDFEWRGYVPERIMPWYVMAHDGQRTDGYGVRTGAAAFCCWQVDTGGLSLWADVRSGGVPVQLGQRQLELADVTCRAGHANESPFVALHAFCRQLCATPRLPAEPVYGNNDWYWAYGKNGAASALNDAQRLVDLSPTGANRPFVVIDDGWQPGRGASTVGAGNWDRGNENFPDLPGLVTKVKQAGARMGAWIRPLEAATAVPDSWRLSRDRGVLDPTVAAVREKIAADMARLRGWGMELIKHDYSTWDIFGRWGFQMSSAMTKEGWQFAEGPKRTTAEVINAMYQDIRRGAGDALVIGCNTVSHLSAGVFELCRIGDDVSGTEWARTRKMGPNTLAFRAAQHGAFYAADPDCAPITTTVPWARNRQWLELLGRSGLPLFVSLAPDALGPEQRTLVREALARAATRQPVAEPTDWLHNSWPRGWRMGNRLESSYDWGPAEG